ncbi:uncharacterized protein FMAN_08565 [Fusarium mangiferae]|uniref:Uncharacterized protein n=1 Tax=Fusarium mangiferae TaxID=192010 RepID=A0A1L7TUW0_FUSMA|nr:uncharacterized protein FMAN_08565 [Fusarium mangiferae]CVK98596.1 uncharacterized protein FMAN_08565 [Fusarium mangiferae]
MHLVWELAETSRRKRPSTESATSPAIEGTKCSVIALTTIAASGGIADTKLSLLEVAGKMKKSVDELGGLIAGPQAVADGQDRKNGGGREKF